VVFFGNCEYINMYTANWFLRRVYNIYVCQLRIGQQPRVVKKYVLETSALEQLVGRHPDFA